MHFQWRSLLSPFAKSRLIATDAIAVAPRLVVTAEASCNDTITIFNRGNGPKRAESQLEGSLKGVYAGGTRQFSTEFACRYRHASGTRPSGNALD